MKSLKKSPRRLLGTISSVSLIAALAISAPLSVSCEPAEITAATASVSRYQSNNEGINDGLMLLSNGYDDYEYRSSQKPAYVNSNAVLIRSGSSDESEVLFAADYATKLYVMGEDVNQSNGWTKVYCNNVTGFIRTEYLSDEVLFINAPQYIYISDTTPLRSSPELRDDNIVQTLYQNNRFKQVGYNADWLQVESDGAYYYIDSKFYSSDMIFVEEEKTMYLSRESSLKSKPISSDTYNEVYLDAGSKVKQLEYNSTWVKVEYDNNIYYIEKAFLSPYYSQHVSNSYKITFDDTEYSGDLAVVIETAYNFLGTNYIWGMATPYATDCSGLVLQCYDKIGITLPHQSSQQAYYGRDVMGEDIKPGDIICFSSKYSSTISHVAIYVGDGMMIHAANSTQGCIASDLNRYCENGGTIRAVRRFIE